MRRLPYLFALLWFMPDLSGQTSGNPGVNLCEAAAMPAMVRAEGIAELAGDVVITCINATAPGVPVTASEAVMNVFLRGSVDVTNDIDFGAGANRADAVLVVNENNCAAPSADGGRFEGCGAPMAGVQDPQFGERTAPDRLQWLSVRVPVPGGPGNPAATTLRISGLRLRASQNGMPHAASIPDSHIRASVSLAAQGFSMVNSGIVGVAFPVLGLFPAIPGSMAGQRCRSTTLSAPLTLQEGFASALRVAGPPSFFPVEAGTEAGYFAAGHPGRILLRFSNIPQGVTLTLPRIVETGNPAVSGDGLRVQWVEGGMVDGSGGTVSAAGGVATVSAPPGGSAFAIYQVMDANPNVLEALPLNIEASWAAGAGAGVVRVGVHPAPLSTVVASNLAAPEPRFLDSGVNWSYFSVTPCRSTLLFSYAKHGPGEDTRLIVDNRTTDIPGLGPQTGACRLRFRGQNAPAEHTTAPIAAGTQLDAPLSSLAPGFSGHVVAECDFEAAAGTALLSRGGAVYQNEAETLGANGVGVPNELAPLLFPYAVESAGFDTVLAVANPSLDVPGGVPPHGGACRFDYFGFNAPPAQVSTAIAPGQGLAFALSAGSPAHGIAPAAGFAGYVTAACAFAYARGFAAVTQLSGGQAVRGYGLAAEPFQPPLTVTPPEEEPPPEEPRTALLLPYVSNRAGEDTLLAVSNTTADTVGTIPQGGSCTLRMHGDGVTPTPGPQTFPLSPGEQAAFLASQGDPGRAIAAAPGFRGYATLACDFPRARAVALTAHPGGSLAQSAEALVLPRNATPAPLLQPYVSAQGAEDRVVAIASTSLDPFGTTPAHAACSLAFRGAGAPAGGGLAIAPGAVRAFRLSRGAPALGIPAAAGFQGFVQITCAAGLVRAEDYRVAPDPSLRPFCEMDGTPGVQPADVAILTGMLGQTAAIGDPGDPNADGVITVDDVQYCNSQATGLLLGVPPPAPPPDPLSAAADLRISWEASPGVARPQRALTFYATATNAGPGSAPNVVVTLYPPADLVTGGPPPSCMGGANVWTCELGALAAGQSVTLAMAGTVKSTASAELAAAAEARSTAFDPNTANNVATLIAPLENQADLAVSAYLLPQMPAPGETATLTISVTNRGPGGADAVVLEGELGAALQLEQTPAGCSTAGRVVRCQPGALASGRTRAYLLTVRLLGGAAGPLAIVTAGAATPDFAERNNSLRLDGVP